MSLALYRTYRPARLADVVGQEHITTPLARALDNDRVHHAYLFSGPRGCGKTSTARGGARPCMGCAWGVHIRRLEVQIRAQLMCGAVWHGCHGHWLTDDATASAAVKSVRSRMLELCVGP